MHHELYGDAEENTSASEHEASWPDSKEGLLRDERYRPRRRRIASSMRSRRRRGSFGALQLFLR